jgi:hypothetical protein
VEKQFLAWGKLYAQGKELRLLIVFHYTEDDLSRNEKRGKSSVTKKMLNKRDAQLDAEEYMSEQQSVWRAVYSLMRCPSLSCHLGPHCWQDPHHECDYQRTLHVARHDPVREGLNVSVLTHGRMADLGVENYSVESLKCLRQ